MATTFIAGRALDSVDLTPLPGATVTEVTNPSNTSTADSDGSFSLTVSDPSTQLIISYLGYASLQDKASNLNGDDWLQSNTKAYAGLYQTARQSGSMILKALIVTMIVVILLKIFKLA